MSGTDEVGRQRARRRTKAEQIAQSNYGQIRLTVTFERQGGVTYRALAKRYSDDWRELNVFAQGGERLREYPADFACALEVFAMIAENLRWMPSERG